MFQENWTDLSNNFDNSTPQFSWNDTQIVLGGTNMVINQETDQWFVISVLVGSLLLVAPVNLSVMFWIKTKIQTLIDKLMFLDCVTNIGAMTIALAVIDDMCNRWVQIIWTNNSPPALVLCIRSHFAQARMGGIELMPHRNVEDSHEGELASMQATTSLIFRFSQSSTNNCTTRHHNTCSFPQEAMPCSVVHSDLELFFYVNLRGILWPGAIL